jgi:hypothetical protein
MSQQLTVPTAAMGLIIGKVLCTECVGWQGEREREGKREWRGEEIEERRVKRREK